MAVCRAGGNGVFRHPTLVQMIYSVRFPCCFRGLRFAQSLSRLGIVKACFLSALGLSGFRCDGAAPDFVILLFCYFIILFILHFDKLSTSLLGLFYRGFFL